MAVSDRVCAACAGRTQGHRSQSLLMCSLTTLPRSTSPAMPRMPSHHKIGTPHSHWSSTAWCFLVHASLLGCSLLLQRVSTSSLYSWSCLPSMLHLDSVTQLQRVLKVTKMMYFVSFRLLLGWLSCLSDITGRYRGPHQQSLPSHDEEEQALLDELLMSPLTKSSLNSPSPLAPASPQQTASCSQQPSNNTALGVVGMLRRLKLWTEEDASTGKLTILPRSITEWLRSTNRCQLHSFKTDPLLCCALQQTDHVAVMS